MDKQRIATNMPTWVEMAQLGLIIGQNEAKWHHEVFRQVLNLRDTLFNQKNIGISSSSTIAGIFILNSLWTEMYKFLKNEKLIPFYKSSNLPNGSNIFQKEIPLPYNLEVPEKKTGSLFLNIACQLCWVETQHTSKETQHSRFV